MVVCDKDFLLKFVEHYGFEFHPNKDIDKTVDKMNEVGHCLCSSKRLMCPCMKCINEVTDSKFMSCKCTLIVSKDYLKKYGYVKNGD